MYSVGMWPGAWQRFYASINRQRLEAHPKIRYCTWACIELQAVLMFFFYLKKKKTYMINVWMQRKRSNAACQLRVVAWENKPTQTFAEPGRVRHLWVCNMLHDKAYILENWVPSSSKLLLWNHILNQGSWYPHPSPSVMSIVVYNTLQYCYTNSAY